VRRRARPAPRLAIAAIVLCLALFGGTASAGTGWSHDRTIFGRTVTIGAGEEIEGNLNVVNARVICEAGGRIDGDVRTYFGDFEPQAGCIVRGAVADAFGAQSALAFVPWLAPDAAERTRAEHHRILVQIAYGLIVLVMFLLFPMRTRLALDRVEHHPGLAAVVGTLALIAALPVAILLALTVVGIPLIFVEVAGLFGVLWIGEAAVALSIGRRFYELVRPHATPTPLGALVLGLVLIGAAELLPVVGWAVWAIVTLVGVGAVLLEFVQQRIFRRFDRPGAGPVPGRSVATRR